MSKVASILHIHTTLDDSKVIDIITNTLANHQDEAIKKKASRALELIAHPETPLPLFDKITTTICLDSRSKTDLSPVTTAFLYCDKHNILPDKESKKYKVIPNEVAEKKKIEVKMPAACKNKREAKKYCICQSIYTDGELMLFCEGGCENWYHPKCVGITEEDAKRMGSNPNEKWICSKCQPNMKLKRKKKL